MSSNFPIRVIRANSWLVLGFVLGLAVTAASQELPTEIRGYKVHTPGTSASNDPNAGHGAFVRLDKPAIKLDGLLSVGVEAGGEFTSLEQSGRVEFLSFHDIRVNGIAVEIDEYQHKFKFKKGEPVVLAVAAPRADQLGRCRPYRVA